MTKYGFAFITILGLGFASPSLAQHATVKLTQIEPTSEQAVWSRDKQVTPRYPKELAIKGIMGCGVFKVNVSADGETEQVELLSSVPANTIERPAAKVIRQWQWKNRSGQPNQAETKTLRLDFCMSRGSKEDVEARCNQQAQLQCKAS